eukprot:577985-Rhodomonas_salina.1
MDNFCKFLRSSLLHAVRIQQYTRMGYQGTGKHALTVSVEKREDSNTSQYQPTLPHSPLSEASLPIPRFRPSLPWISLSTTHCLSSECSSCKSTSRRSRRMTWCFVPNCAPPAARRAARR